MCCRAFSAECLACSNGVSVEEFCAENPGTADCPEEPTICCRALTADCLACSAGVTVEQYCQDNAGTAGCPEEPTMCCRAFSAECLACSNGVSVEEFCAENPGTADCPEEPTICCRALTADCLACSAGVSVEQYCVEHAGTAGCPDVPTICCRAMTADCLACAAGVTVEEFCEENMVMGCPNIHDDMAQCCSANPPDFCRNVIMEQIIAIGALTTDHNEVGTTYTYHSEEGYCEQVSVGCCWSQEDMHCLACQAGVHPDDYCASEHSSAHPEFCITGEDCCGVADPPDACRDLHYPIALGHGFTGDYTQVSSTVEWTGQACHHMDIMCCWWESLECHACMEQVSAEDFCGLHAEEYPWLCGPPVGEQCCVAEPPEWCATTDMLRAIGDAITMDYTEIGVEYSWRHDTCFEMHTHCCFDPHDLGCLACLNEVHPDQFCTEHWAEHPVQCLDQAGEHCCVESPPEDCSDVHLPVRMSSLGTTHFHWQVNTEFHWDGYACREHHMVCCDMEDVAGCLACQRQVDPLHFCDEHAQEFPVACEGHPSLVNPEECCQAEPVDGCDHVEFPIALGHGMTEDHSQVGTTYTWSGGGCVQISTSCCRDEWNIGCLACMHQISREEWCTGEHAADNPQLCLTGEDCCVSRTSRPEGCDTRPGLHLNAQGMGFTSDYTQVGTTWEWSEAHSTCTETYIGCCFDESRSCAACTEGVAVDDLCTEHAAQYPEYCIPVDQAPAAVCPEGWSQRGEIGADIGGCGLTSCAERYDVDSEADCAARCDEHAPECMGFNFAPMNGDRNHPGVTACTIYPSDMPTGSWTGTQGVATQVFCSRSSGSIATAGPPVHVLIDTSEDNRKCVTAPVPVICADTAGHYGNRVNLDHVDAPDTFLIEVGGEGRNEVCATRTDVERGWGMHLELPCVTAPAHILIGDLPQSEAGDANRKCVQHPYPVTCAGDAGHQGNRINSHSAGDTFEITTEGNEVCATRTNVQPGTGWGMQLEIACIAATSEEIEGQIVAGPPVNILIDNSETDEKCVEAPYPVICASDSGHLGNRVNTHQAEDQFEITTDGTQVCARRLDSITNPNAAAPAGWGMHLEVTCVAAPLQIFIGNSESNQRCVTASHPVTCADDAGHLGSRVNQDHATAGDTFQITSAGSQVCARRTDVDQGWGMQLEIVCVVQPGCSHSLMGGGIHNHGRPDQASRIQFIDIGAGAMPTAGRMTSVTIRLGRRNQDGLKFQVYRPAGGNEYDLIMESEALDTRRSTDAFTIQLTTPLEYQLGDYIGWVHTEQGTMNFHSHSGSGGNVLWKYGIQDVGSRINFDGSGNRVYSYEANMEMC